MEDLKCLENLGFSLNEAKVYTTLLKHKALNGYEIAKLSGVARSLVYEVLNRLVAKGAVIRLEGEPSFYKPLPCERLIEERKKESERNFCLAERLLRSLSAENGDDDYVMNLVGAEKGLAKAREMIRGAQAEISLSVWNGTLQALREELEEAVARGVKVYVFAFEKINLTGAIVFSYAIRDAQKLFPYYRTTLIVDGGECLVGEDGDTEAVFFCTRNHSLVSLATDEIVLNIFWYKFIAQQHLLAENSTCDEFLRAIGDLGAKLGINENMTKNFMVYNFQRGKLKDEEH